MSASPRLVTGGTSSAFLLWTEKSGTLRTLLFDCVTEEGQTLTNTVTEHPVEEGANIADHVRNDLEEVKIDVFVTNTPIFTEAAESRGNRTGKVWAVELNPVAPYKAPLEATPGALFSAVGDAVSSGVDSLLGGNDKEKYGANVLKWGEEFDAVGETFTTLKRIRDTSAEVQVWLSRTPTPPAMVLTKLEMRRSKTTGTGAEMSLTFKELKKVKVSLVGAPKPTEPRAKPKVAKGPQDTKPVSAPEKKKAILKGMVDAIRGK